MTDVPSLATLRQVFAVVFPMRGVVVVGAGRGQGLEDFRSAVSVLLVDARRECIEPLQKRCLALPNATAVQAVIAARSGAVAFHFASKPDESALITPESLQPFWRNLTTNSVDEVEAVTLPDLLASLAPEPDFRCNWLVIDCLPALSVLEGARGLVDDVDVIELRCVRDGAVAVEGGVDLESAEQWLEARGFHLAAQFEETLPQLCKAVFCRDVSKLGAKVGDLENDLAQLKRGSEEQLRLLSAESEAKSAAEKLATDLQTHLDALSTEYAALKAARDAALKEKAALAAARDAALKEKDALTSARDAALKEKEVLTAEREALAKAKIALTQALDEQIQLAAERATLLDTLTQSKSAAEKLAADRQTQLDALSTENTALTAARDAALKEKAALAAARDAALKEKDALTSARDAALKEKEVLAAEREALAKAKIALTQALDEQIQLAAERATLLDTLTQSKSAAEKLAAERQSQLDALSTENAALAAARDAALKEKAALAAARDAALKEKDALTSARDAALKEKEVVAAEREALSKAKATLTTERDALKQTVAEGQYRQALLEEEMAKANAQLELIKDLLLREPGL